MRTYCDRCGKPYTTTAATCDCDQYGIRPEHLCGVRPIPKSEYGGEYERGLRDGRAEGEAERARLRGVLERMIVEVDEHGEPFNRTMEIARAALGGEEGE